MPDICFLKGKRHFKAIISYDGSKFFGMQKQPNKLTVQGSIEDALKKLNIITNVKHAGRTDRGVHALNQVIAFNAPAFWEKEWIDLVLQRIKATPEHHFLFLSKAPESYLRFVDGEPFLPANVWLGATVLNNKQLIQFQNTLFALKGYGAKIIFVSLEPLLEPISPHLIDTPIDWIIIGAQTNPYRPPKREWVEEIVEFASDVNIPVFLKENLGPVWGDNLIREFPF